MPLPWQNKHKMPVQTVPRPVHARPGADPPRPREMPWGKPNSAEVIAILWRKRDRTTLEDV